MAESLNDILENLNSLKKNSNIFIPSLKKNVDFKGITLKQQKEIIDSVLSGDSVEILNFFDVCFNILKENIQGNSIEQINIVDRPNLLLNLRFNIDSKYEGINIEELIETNKKIKLPELQTTIETDDFIFTVESPNIKKDANVNNYIVKTFLDREKILGNLYAGELIKFITTVKFKESENVINFDDQSNKNKFTIIQSIDTKHFKEIFAFINSIRDIETEFLTVQDKQIDITPDFFIF